MRASSVRGRGGEGCEDVESLRQGLVVLASKRRFFGGFRDSRVHLASPLPAAQRSRCSTACSITVIRTIVGLVFDPIWNAQHRAVIYGVIVVVLFLSGMGLPLPEDIPLTVSGFTTFKQGGDTFVWWRYLITFFVVVVPILLGDLCAYTMGRRFGLLIRDRFRLLRKALNDARVARVQGWFQRYGSAAVFLGRQVAGVRFVTFFMAGTMRMKVSKFVLWDFMGCVVSVPIWLTLGTLAAHFGRRWLHAATRTVGGTFLIAVAIAALGLFLLTKLRGSSGPRPEETGPTA